MAVKLDPGFSEAHNNYGTLLIDLGRYDEAIEHFRVALNDILYPTPLSRKAIWDGLTI